MKKSKYVAVGLPICRMGEDYQTLTLTIKTKDGQSVWKTQTIKDRIKLGVWENIEFCSTPSEIFKFMSMLCDRITKEEQMKILQELEQNRAIVYFDKEHPEQTLSTLNEIQLVPQGGSREKGRLSLARREIKVSSEAYDLWIQLQQGMTWQKIVQLSTGSAMDLMKALDELIKDQLVILM